MENKKREPFLHITKRMDTPFWKGLIVRAVAIIVSLVLAAIIVCSFSKTNHNFFGVYQSLFKGTFGTSRKTWIFFQEMALLLGASLALVPAFKMKFWNLGGNGQILIGCLACTMCMYYLGGKMPDPVVWILMVISSIVAGAIWGVIPAIFKALFRTNESLFTLMLNYIATIIVSFFVSFWYPTGTGNMPPLANANLPTLGSGQMGKSLLPIIVVCLVTIGMFIYLNFSKHGYEISVVGESENTAKYIGINVKKVLIRTMILSGGLCGLIGCLLSGAINHCISAGMDANMGFTGIMIAWLAKFNPLTMVFTSGFVAFVTKGMNQVNSTYGFSSTALSSVIIGIIYFFIIACEFFIHYKININNHAKEKIRTCLGKIKSLFQKKETNSIDNKEGEN